MKGSNNIFVDKNSLVSGAFSAEAKICGLYIGNGRIK